MTPELIIAAVRLAGMLTAENAALTALDLPRAAGLLAQKQRAIDAFAAAEILARHAAPNPGSRAEAERLAAHLRDLAEENRRLLERAIGVQGRLIGLVARAIPRATAQRNGQRYGAGGDLATHGKPPAFALCARA